MGGQLKRRGDGAPPAVREKKRHRVEASTDGGETAGEGTAMETSRIRPIIRRDVEPKVFHVDPAAFKEAVQILTGSCETRRRHGIEAAVGMILDGALRSPATCASVGSLPSDCCPCSSNGSAAASSAVEANDGGGAFYTDDGAGGSSIDRIAQAEVQSMDLAQRMLMQQPSLSSSSLRVEGSVFTMDSATSCRNAQVEEHSQDADSAASFGTLQNSSSTPFYCAQDLEPSLAELHFRDWLCGDDDYHSLPFY